MTERFASFRLDGRRALVTGGDAGIGLDVAKALASANARVAVCGLAGSAAVAAELGAEAIGIDADIGAASELGHLIERVMDVWGGIDILVLNAAVQFREKWEAIGEASFDRQIDVNLKAGYRLVQAFVPGMAARKWGRLLAIGSVQEAKPHPEMLIYAALKAAQSNMLSNLARQLAPCGVTCNVIAPGVIETARNSQALADPAYRARILQGIPAGAFGQPEDCAGAALLLCSDAGRYITGAVLPVDGGMAL